MLVNSLLNNYYGKTCKCHLYCRVSSKKQSGSEHVSLEAQEKEIKEVLNKGGLNIIIHGVTQEAGSAYRSEGCVRNKQRKLCKLAEELPNDTAIITYSLDRLTRSTKFAIEFFELCRKRNIQIFSIKEPLDYGTASGKKLIIDHISLAEQTSGLMSEKAKTVRKYLQSIGSHIGYVPFGYMCVSSISKEGKQIKKLVENPTEQLVVKLIIALRDGEESENPTIDDINKLLYRIKPEADAPIIIENHNRSFNDSLQTTLKMGEMEPRDIANLLNEYEIFRRGRKWSDKPIRTVYRYYVASKRGIDVNALEEKFTKMRVRDDETPTKTKKPIRKHLLHFDEMSDDEPPSKSKPKKIRPKKKQLDASDDDSMSDSDNDSDKRETYRKSKKKKKY